MIISSISASFSRHIVRLQNIRLLSKVPATPVQTLEREDSSRVNLDENIISLLERLSLVKCDTAEGVKVLEDSIIFANKILHINTENVEPLYTVLEKENLNLRPDLITQGKCQKDILRNASVKEDDYFVAPPGNIPLHEVHVIQSKNLKMNSVVKKITSLKNFFQIIDTNSSNIRYCFKNPSVILMENAYVQWLQSIWLKADKHFVVHLSEKSDNEYENQKLPFGFLQTDSVENVEKSIVEHDVTSFLPNNKTRLKFSLIVPEKDIMQYFFQWQKYRKYWWSSITTTPGLFNISDIKYEDKLSQVEIRALLPWGDHVVEELSIKSLRFKEQSLGRLECYTSLETALLTVLADGMINSSKEEYLRIHRKMAPFKISYALQYEDEKSKNTLFELAVLLNSKLSAKNIKTWFPEFVLSLEDQIKENLELGVVYTVILSEKTLTNGILDLMNSSTMLQEQTHVADFETYAALLFQN